MCKRLLLLFSFIFGTLYASGHSAYADVPYGCLSQAKNMPLVTISHNYGVLGLDNTKTSAQISQICKEGDAAGCFAHHEGYRLKTDETTVRSGNNFCVVPLISVEYDFSPTMIYIVKEYSSCQARAVLRHELQHFAIWKTATEEMLKEAKTGLKNLALQNITQCRANKPCSTGIMPKAKQYIHQLRAKWEKISLANNHRLDDVDHNPKTDFNYVVCTPYSLKFIQ